MNDTLASQWQNFFFYFYSAPITSSLMDVSEHPAYFAYVIRHLDEDGDGMISSDEMNNALV